MSRRILLLSDLIEVIERKMISIDNIECNTNSVAILQKQIRLQQRNL